MNTTTNNHAADQQARAMVRNDGGELWAVYFKTADSDLQHRSELMCWNDARGFKLSLNFNGYREVEMVKVQ